MNMDTTHAFMLEEYKQMIKIYTDLLGQNSKMLTFYAAIIGVGASVITALFKLSEEISSISPVFLLESIGLLAILLSLVGSIIFFSLLGLRIEMILYIRTINAVRGYFVEEDKNKLNNKAAERDNDEQNNEALQIEKFLVLPYYDEETPPFRDSWMSWFFWTLLLIAFINSAMLAAGIYLLFSGEGETRIIIALHLLLICLGIHFLLYYKITSHMRDTYVTKRKIPESKEERGTIVT